MILYFIGGIILIIILIFLFIRIKYRFWALQPVFHFYDLYYWFVNVGIIRHELPSTNRYTNFKEIKTYSFDRVPEDNLREFATLVQLNYFRDKDNIYNPQKENIVPYFEGHNSSAFWSFFWKPDVLINVKTNATIDDKLLVGVITSRPLHVTIYKSHLKSPAKFDAFYVDYLCVRKGFRGKNIAPQLIQTHEYNQCHLNPNISVSLFKREEDITGIVPLTIYKTYCFDMKNWNIPPEPLHSKVNLLVGDKQNMYYLYNFINETKGKWDITIIPEISNLLKLIDTNNLFIIMLLVEGNIEAFYIFKKTCTNIEKDKEAISCIASQNGYILTKKEFIQGFKLALWSVLEKQKNHYKFLIIEDVSDNGLIIDNIKIKTYPIATSPTAYFFYNFVYSPFKNDRALIVN
jgi:ribosomal protein S18 acetylase RimI-like enzyme